MRAREVVEQRIVTLSGLLETPGGPLGPAAGALGRDLAASWEAERRLLKRILHESAGGDVQATIAQWRERTAAFLERASGPAPSWSDREGHVWDAREVLRILDDVLQRIDIWLAGDNTAVSTGNDAAADRARSGDRGARASAAASHTSGTGGADLPDGGADDLDAEDGDGDEDEDEDGDEEDEADDDDDNTRYISVLRPDSGP